MRLFPCLSPLIPAFVLPWDEHGGSCNTQRKRERERRGTRENISAAIMHSCSIHKERIFFFSFPFHRRRIVSECTWIIWFPAFHCCCLNRLVKERDRGKKNRWVIFKIGDRLRFSIFLPSMKFSCSSKIGKLGRLKRWETWWEHLATRGCHGISFENRTG